MMNKSYFNTISPSLSEFIFTILQFIIIIIRRIRFDITYMLRLHCCTCRVKGKTANVGKDLLLILHCNFTALLYCKYQLRMGVFVYVYMSLLFVQARWCPNRDWTFNQNTVDTSSGDCMAVNTSAQYANWPFHTLSKKVCTHHTLR